MRIFIFLTLALTFISNLSFANPDTWEAELLEKFHLRENTRGNSPREHVIDPYRVSRLEKKETYYTRCNSKKFDNFYEHEQCIKKASSNYRDEYPDRGTDAYGEKNYTPLSKEEGKNKRDELLKLLDWVSFYPKSGNDDTELTVQHLKKEIRFIERYVMRIHPRSYETR